jgi:hypothetical protein
MFKLRAKTIRNGVWNEINTFNTFNEVVIFVSNQEYTNGEITDNGKVIFNFTIDEKTSLLLRVIREISGDKTPEIIPKTQTTKKPKRTVKK